MILSVVDCSVKTSPIKERGGLNRREQKRLRVLNLVEEGKMIGRMAARVVGLFGASSSEIIGGLSEGEGYWISPWQSWQKTDSYLCQQIRDQVVQLPDPEQHLFGPRSPDFDLPGFKSEIMI